MKKFFLASLILISGLFCSAQKQNGLTFHHVPKTYVSASLSYYNGSGPFCQQAQPTVEFGITGSNISVGIANGFTAFNDGNFYSELRISPTFWQSGRWAVSGSLGAGYVFNKANQLLTEYSGGVGYSVSDKVSVSLFAGKYYFSGKTISSSATFSGAGVTFTF